MPASMLSRASVFSSSGSSLSRMPLMYVPKTPSSVLRACNFLLSQASKEFAATAIDPGLSYGLSPDITPHARRSEMEEGIRYRLVATASKPRECQSHLDTGRHSPPIETIISAMPRTSFGQDHHVTCYIARYAQRVSKSEHADVFKITFFLLKI